MDAYWHQSVVPRLLFCNVDEGKKCDMTASVKLGLRKAAVLLASRLRYRGRLRNIVTACLFEFLSMTLRFISTHKPCADYLLEFKHKTTVEGRTPVMKLLLSERTEKKKNVDSKDGAFAVDK